MTWCSGSVGGGSDVNDLHLCLQVWNAEGGSHWRNHAGQWVVGGAFV